MQFRHYNQYIDFFLIDLKDHVNFIDINNVCNMPLYEKNAKSHKEDTHTRAQHGTQQLQHI